MKNSKIIPLLKSLSSDEMKQFGKYIVYKSTNKESKVLDFYNYLEKYHPKFPDGHIDKMRIAQKLYPTEKEAKGLKNINNLILRLTPLLKSFMIQIELEKQEENAALLYLEALKSRKLTIFFFDRADKLEKDWEKDVIPGIKQLLNLYRLKKMRFDYPGFLKQSEFPIQPNIIIKQLEQFYIAEKLYWTLNGHFTGKFLRNEACNENEQPIPMENLINEVERKHLSATKQIELLTKIFKVVGLNETIEYEEIEHDFFENYKLFSCTEIKDLVTYLSHICFTNHQKGCVKALNNLFRINKFAAEKDYLYKMN